MAGNGSRHLGDGAGHGKILIQELPYRCAETGSLRGTVSKVVELLVPAPGRESPLSRSLCKPNMNGDFYLSSLPPEQQGIWDAFTVADMSGFMLYGGTALALQYGHRLSIDFDFFGSPPVSSNSLEQRIPWLRKHTVNVLQDEINTYTVQAICPGMPDENTVKLSFFGEIDFPTLDPPIVASNGIKVASPRDILATKLKAVHGRIESKDYIDIAEILRRSDDPVTRLSEGLADYNVLFPDANPSIPLKALCWFRDDGLSTVNQSTRKLLENTVSAVTNIPKARPAFRPQIGLD